MKQRMVDTYHRHQLWSLWVFQVLVSFELVITTIFNKVLPSLASKTKLYSFNSRQESLQFFVLPKTRPQHVLIVSSWRDASTNLSRPVRKVGWILCSSLSFRNKLIMIRGLDFSGCLRNFLLIGSKLLFVSSKESAARVVCYVSGQNFKLAANKKRRIRSAILFNTLDEHRISGQYVNLKIALVPLAVVYTCLWPSSL